MIDRQDMIEEQLLRENIRKAIRIVKKRKLQQESAIRTIVRVLLKEADDVTYPYTSLNKLHDLFRDVIAGAKESSQPAFKHEYKSLTSDKSARQRYVEYILDFASADFNLLEQPGGTIQPIGSDFAEIGYEPEEEEIEPEEEENLTVSIDDLNKSGNDLVEPDLGEEEEEVFGEDAPEDTGPGSQADSTLRSARRAYSTIGPALQLAWDDAPTDEIIPDEVTIDQNGQQITHPAGSMTEGDLFKIYFSINLKLWAAKIEQEMTPVPESSVDIGAGTELETDELGAEEDFSELGF